MDTHPKHDIALGAVQYQPTTAVVPAAEPEPEAGPRPPPGAAPVRWPSRDGAEAGSPFSDTQPHQPFADDEPAGDRDPEPVAAAPGEGAAGGSRGLIVGDHLGAPHEEGAEPLRARWAVVAAAALAVLLVAGGGLWLLLGSDDEPPTSAGPPTSDPSTRSSSPSPSARIPPSSLVVPLAPEAGTIDLFEAPRDGSAPEPLLELDGAQWLPTLSAGREWVYFRSAPTTDRPTPDQFEAQLYDVGSGETRDMFTAPRSDDANCTGRPAWHPDQSNRVAVVCSDVADDLGTGKRVYEGVVTESGQVETESLELIDGLDDPSISNISYVGSGGLVMKYLGGEEPGIYYLPPGSSELVALASSGQDPMGSPQGDRVAFERDGDIYLVMAAEEPADVDCPGETEPDPGTDFALCQVTEGPEWDMDATWSPDATQLAFRRADSQPAPADMFVPTDLLVIDLAPEAEPQELTGVAGQVVGTPIWGPR